MTPDRAAAMPGPVRPRPLFLTGMMGSGKTTVAQGLAARAKVPWCDLDRRIEHMTGRTVSALFEQGEAQFRAWESIAITTLVREPGLAERGFIVATGGGAVVAPENRRALAEIGVLVFLAVPLEELERRLTGVAARPLLAGGLHQTLTRLWRTRELVYRDGSIEVDATGDPEEVINRVWSAVGGDQRWTI